MGFGSGLADVDPADEEKGSNHDVPVMAPWERRSPVVARPSRSGRQQAKQARSSPAIQPPHHQRRFGLLMGRQVRTMIDQSLPPGSADVPVGSHFEWVADADVGAPRSDGPLATGFASIPQQRGATITILIPRALHSPQPSTSPHLQAYRPQAHGPRSTHNGPPTSHGGARPRAAAPQTCCEPLTSRGPKGPHRNTRSRAAKCEPTGTSALPG